MAHRLRRAASGAAALAAALGASVLLLAPPVYACAPVVVTNTTVVLDGTDALAAGAQATTAAHYMGRGAWEAVLGQKMELYIDPSKVPAFKGASIKIRDIKSISYETNTPVAVTGKTPPDFSMNIYTMPLATCPAVNGSSCWYGYRLSAEPYFSRGLNAPANQWNTWSTTRGSNQLTFYDSNQDGVYGFYGQPTLWQIQNGETNWHSYYSKAPTTDISYGSQTVKYFEFGTGSAWDNTFHGYIDAINITLYDGTSVTFDLEPNIALPPPLQFLDITTPAAPGHPNGTVVSKPNGTVGEFLFYVLHSQGGAGYGNWSLKSGDLPPGLQLESSGAILGVPTKAGTYHFTVAVTDLSGTTATHDVTMTIKDAP